MPYKKRSFVFMLLMMMLFSGIVYGQDDPQPRGIIERESGTGTEVVTVYDQLGFATYQEVTVPTPGLYRGDGYVEGNGNLIIGGIRQNSPDPNQNKGYEIFADDLHARYLPTYYSGPVENKGDEYLKYVEDGADVADAASGIPSYENGLKDPALIGGKYNTIIAYSGGTASAVTALDKQGVTCKTLILVSPMKGLLSQQTYDEMIQRILNNNAVDKIIVLQSKDDTPTAHGWPLNYQAEFTKGADLDITVVEVPLTTTGNDGHKEMLTYAKNHIEIGEDGAVTVKPPTWQEELAARIKNQGEFRQSGPMISKPTSDTLSNEGPSGSDISDIGSLSGQGNSGSAGGLTAEQKQAIQEWLDSGAALEQVNEANHYESTLPCPITIPGTDIPNTWGYYWIYEFPDLSSEQYKKDVEEYLATHGSGDYAEIGPLA